MKRKFLYITGFMTLLVSPIALSGECRSCQEHRNGGSITYGSVYAPGGIYQPGGTYYPGGVYPSYGSYSNYGNTPYNQYNRNSGHGSFTQTCGYGSARGDHNASGNGCVTRYRGPASDINQLPRINRQIHQSQPHGISVPARQSQRH